MRQRTSRIVTVAAGLAAAAALAGGPGAQGPRRADAEYLRTAYDTYRSMARSSPYAGVPWQYLGPTNISGRATARCSWRRPRATTSRRLRRWTGWPAALVPTR